MIFPAYFLVSAAATAAPVVFAAAATSELASGCATQTTASMLQGRRQGYPHVPCPTASLGTRLRWNICICTASTSPRGPPRVACCPCCAVRKLVRRGARRLHSPRQRWREPARYAQLPQVDDMSRSTTQAGEDSGAHADLVGTICSSGGVRWAGRPARIAGRGTSRLPETRRQRTRV